LILVLVCLSTFGDYYCIDNPGALHEQLKNQFSNLGNSFEYYFNLLYSLYSLPNIFLPFLGGIFVMLFGIRLMYFIFGMFLLLGQFTFALGGSLNNIYIMLLGRVLFGFGGECLNITQSAMIVKWFLKSEIALPLGLTISISRLGSVLNDNLSPRIATINDASKPLWIGFIFCIISFVASMLLCYIDYNEDKRRPEESQGVIQNSEENYSFFETLKNLSIIFWTITALCVTLYSCVLPFNNIASGFFANTWFKEYPKDQATHKAGIAMSIPFFISAFLVPFFGVFIDKFGNRAYLSFVSSFLCLIAFSMFFFSSPLYAVILIGITYSLFASVIWPAISLVVNYKIVGFAYGVTTSLQNLGLVVFPLIVAYIYSSSNNYYYTLYLFIVLACVSILLSTYLIYLDHVNNNIINTNIFPEDKETDDVEKKSLIKNEERAPDSTSKADSNSTNYNSINK